MMLRSCCASPRRPRPGGFTLIEVMVVLVIMSIMALLSWQGIQTLLKTRELSLRLVTAVDSIQTAVSQWRVDLDNTLSAPVSTAVGNMDWDGRVLRLVRRSSSMPPPNTNSSFSAAADQAALWVVAWSARSMSAEELQQLPVNEQRPGLYWLRWQSPAFTSQSELNAYWQMAGQWGQNPSAEARTFESVLFEIQNWQVYFFRNNAWTNALSSDGSSATSAATLQPNANSTLGAGAGANTGINSGGSSGTSATSTSNANNATTNPTATGSGSTSTAASTLIASTTGAVFPDGIRLKLYLAPDRVLGSGMQAQSLGDTPLDPSLTVDWVRLNFTTPIP